MRNATIKTCGWNHYPCRGLWRIDEGANGAYLSARLWMRYTLMTLRANHRIGKRGERANAAIDPFRTLRAAATSLRPPANHRLWRSNFAILPQYKELRCRTRNPSVRAYKPAKSDRISRSDGRMSECWRKLFARMAVLRTRFKIGKRDSLPVVKKKRGKSRLATLPRTMEVTSTWISRRWIFRSYLEA